MLHRCSLWSVFTRINWRSPDSLRSRKVCWSPPHASIWTLQKGSYDTTRTSNIWIITHSILLMEEILHHQGCIKPCNSRYKLPTSSGARRISEPSTVAPPFDTCMLSLPLRVVWLLLAHLGRWRRQHIASWERICWIVLDIGNSTLWSLGNLRVDFKTWSINVMRCVIRFQYFMLQYFKEMIQYTERFHIYSAQRVSEVY